MQGIPMQAFLQALQPPQTVMFNPFVAPQYPVIAPMPPQPPPLAQVSAPADHPWFQAIVAAASKEVRKDLDKQKAPPPDLSPEDEKKLVDAIKKGMEDKLPMERVFEELSQKHGYTESVWVRWFATNVGKLYPKTFPKANSDRAPGSASDSDAGGSGSNTRSASSNRPVSTVTFVQQQPRPQARSQKVLIATPKPPVASTQAKSTTAAGSSARAPLSSTHSTRPPSTNKPPVPQNTFSGGPTPYSANRSKRGGSVRIVHDQTFIPWSDGSTKPSLPRSQADGSAKRPLPRRTSAPTSTTTAGGSDSGTKLTHDEKVFFVHWLRWRLREGALPEKETLFEELEAELPHRAAEMWKGHWASHCEVPDALYIEARKRAEREDDRGESPLTPLAAPEPSEGSESESESASASSDDQGSTYHASAARKPIAPTNTATKTKTKTKTAPPKGPSRPPGGLPVTDEDLRAMARYRFGKGSDWKNLAYKPRWREFADRPENRKRSWDAWYAISREESKHAAVIDRYVKELESQTAAAAPRSHLKAGPHTASAPQQNRPAVASRASSGAGKQLGDAEAPQKRAAEQDNAGGDCAGEDVPPLKRRKTSWDVNPADIMDLTVDSEPEK